MIRRRPKVTERQPMQLVHRSTSGPLPTSTFVLQDAGQEAGFIQIRHRPSHGKGVPAECASHVYYEVHEPYRRRGYGTKLLELGKAEALRLGLKAIIVGCFSTNPASKRIIERNGGDLQNVCCTEDGEIIFSYRIELQNVAE